VTPVQAGGIPASLLPLIGRICSEQEALNDALANRDLSAIFGCFLADPLVTCSREEAQVLFREMVINTASYLDSYDLSQL